jgi:Uma2 family endonuclease
MNTKMQLTTADDLLKIPEDGFCYKLVRGELRKIAPAGNQHGKRAMRLGSSLFQHVEANKLGNAYAAETGFRLSSNPDTVRAPDVAFVNQKRVKQVGEPEGNWPGAPDLAI